jgi:hypothetical protein
MSYSKFIVLGRPCYEHARDQGTLGSVTGYRYNRTPGWTYDFIYILGKPNSHGTILGDHMIRIVERLIIRLDN